MVLEYDGLSSRLSRLMCSEIKELKKLMSLDGSTVCFIFQESTSSLASSKGGSSSSSSSSKSIQYSWPRRNIELIISFSLSIWNLISLGVSGITHAMKLVTVNTTNWNTNTKARRAESRCQYCLEQLYGQVLSKYPGYLFKRQYVD